WRPRPTSPASWPTRSGPATPCSSASPRPSSATKTTACWSSTTATASCRTSPLLPRRLLAIPAPAGNPGRRPAELRRRRGGPADADDFGRPVRPGPGRLLAVGGRPGGPDADAGPVPGGQGVAGGGAAAGAALPAALPAAGRAGPAAGAADGAGE